MTPVFRRKIPWAFGVQPALRESEVADAPTLDPKMLKVDLLRKSGEFPMSYEELDDTAATVYEGI